LVAASLLLLAGPVDGNMNTERVHTDGRSIISM